MMRLNLENYKTDFIKCRARTMAANTTLSLVLGNPAQLCKAYRAIDIINQEALVAKQVKPPVHQGTQIMLAVWLEDLGT